MAVLALAGAVLAGDAGAQQGVGTVRGVVRRAGGAALAEAEVVVLGGDRIARSGQDGLFTLDRLAAGGHMLLVRRIGYAPLTFSLQLTAGEQREFVAELDPLPRALPELEVRVRSGFATDGRYADLATRIRRGQSRIITNDELRRFPRLATALQMSVPVRFALSDPIGVADWSDPTRANPGLTGGRGTGSVSRGCLYTAVNGGMPTQNVGYDEFIPTQVEALEVIAPSAALATWPWLPIGCGVVVVWF